jgi:hypothetical protein
MTVLGKVLVFVNLGFSLAVAFFITQAYAKRTDWARAYRDADAAMKAANASRDQYAAEAAATKASCESKIATMTGAHQKVVADLDRVNGQVMQLNNELKKKDEIINAAGLGTKGQQNEVVRLNDALTRSENYLKDANKRLDDQAKTVEDLRARAVKAEIDNRELQRRNDQLVGIVEEKDKELIKIKASGGVTTVAGASNPPPGDVEGRVKQYDPTSGLMTITIGSDAGVLKGHTLFVYRLEPSGTYIGQMRVLEVRPNEAVGKMVNKPRSPVQINDKVASKIS